MQMHKNIVLHIVFLFLMVFVNQNAKAATTPEWYQIDANHHVTLRVDLFEVSTCPHCQQANAFLTELANQNSWIELHHHVINQDKEALLLFNEYLQHQDIHDMSVPTIFFCDSRWVGFTTAEKSGKSLKLALQYCYQQIQHQKTLLPESKSALQQMATSYWLAASIKDQTTNYLVLPFLAILAAVSPCSLMGVLLLIALMALSPTKSSKVGVMVIYLFSLFATGLLLQMSLFFLKPYYWPYIIAVFAGVIVLLYLYYFLIKAKNSQVLCVLAAVSIACVTRYYQGGCVPDFSMVFQQRLLAWSMGTAHEFFLHIIYNLIYIGVIALLAFAVTGITYLKRWAYLREWLIRFSIGLLTIMAIVCLVYPMLLSSVLMQFLIPAIALVSVLIVKRLPINSPTDR